MDKGVCRQRDANHFICPYRHIFQVCAETQPVVDQVPEIVCCPGHLIDHFAEIVEIGSASGEAALGNLQPPDCRFGALTDAACLIAVTEQVFDIAWLRYRRCIGNIAYGKCELGSVFESDGVPDDNDIASTVVPVFEIIRLAR